MDGTILIAVVFIAVFIAVLARNARTRRPVTRTRPGRDPQRYATRPQRQVLWHQQHGLCALCRLPLAGRRTECHHVIAWSRGGRTVLSNLVLVHAEPCHARLTAQQRRRRVRV